MSDASKKDGPHYKGELELAQPLKLAAIGIESEFSLFVDGTPSRPEDVFGDPTTFIRQPLIRREGTSYHLPTGGAVYFDTGVIELATPLIEIDRGCAARAGRSLWEAILFLRTELDDWAERERKDVRLAGFSAHYNVSFVRPEAASAGGHDGADPGPDRTLGVHESSSAGVEELALLLVHVLPVPVMLIAANRQSTGIGVRPRGDRIEVTADFTPSPSLMIAAATVITGVVRAVMRWPSYRLEMLRSIPRIDGFEPLKHSTRQGWVARPQSYPQNPFETHADDPVWRVRSGELLSLRQIARRILSPFRTAIRRVADPFTFRLLQSLFVRSAPVLMDVPGRPEGYEDVGRLCRWDDLFPETVLSRSMYERVLIHAIAGDVLRVSGRTYRPVGMRGWSEVVFERLPDGTKQRFSIDFLVQHLNRWGRR